MEETEATPACDALARLQEARVRAEAAHQEDRDRVLALAGQVRHTEDILARLIRRRDHLLAAGEENPVESRQAAELAEAAERLRKNAERSLFASAEVLAAAKERSRKSAEVVSRIVQATNKLSAAIRDLAQVRAEKASRERLADLERTSFVSLQQLGQRTVPVRPLTDVHPAAAEPGLDDYVREVTRLAYEAEALADLQRERAL